MSSVDGQQGRRRLDPPPGQGGVVILTNAERAVCAIYSTRPPPLAHACTALTCKQGSAGGSLIASIYAAGSCYVREHPTS